MLSAFPCRILGPMPIFYAFYETSTIRFINKYPVRYLLIIYKFLISFLTFISRFAPNPGISRQCLKLYFFYIEIS